MRLALSSDFLEFGLHSLFLFRGERGLVHRNLVTSCRRAVLLGCSGDSTVAHFYSRVLFWLLVVVVLFAPLLRVLVHYYFPPTTSLDPAYILMPCRADSLAIGMLVAFVWRKPQSHS